MSGCCSSAKENTCSIPRSEPEVCPSCGKKGKSVPVLTVKSLVRDHTRVLASVTYSFCRTADCEVVYFSNQAAFTKPDLKVRVGIKGRQIQFRSAIVLITAAKISAGRSKRQAKRQCWKKSRQRCKVVFVPVRSRTRVEHAAWVTSPVLSRRRRNAQWRRFTRLIELLTPT